MNGGRRLLPLVLALVGGLLAACGTSSGGGGVPSSSSPSSSAPAPATAPSASAAASVSASATARDVPLLAFYYLWFDSTSWNRAKVDYPRLGRYSSDDPAVLREHVRLARSAGIQGFIVSWKDTPTNDHRLHLLMSLARAQDFKLAMIYQGLDFDRKPLPARRVQQDLTRFRDEFAPDPVFLRLGGRPLTIWSGTWAYSTQDVASVTRAVRPSLLVLNTEKSPTGYARIADLTDGDAYYWSSVNPRTNDNYGPKLEAMSQAVHAKGKYWIAPFAPGFDARLVGGRKSVDRADGRTLRIEYAAALASSPDLLGLISWNEFSENTYVEPSEKFGDRELSVLRDLRGASMPVPAAAVDSSDPGVTGTPPGDQNTDQVPWPNILILGGFVTLLLLGGAVVGLYLRTDRRLRRKRARRRPDPAAPEAKKREDVHISW
jgi:hypothetical protein